MNERQIMDSMQNLLDQYAKLKNLHCVLIIRSYPVYKLVDKSTDLYKYGCVTFERHNFPGFVGLSEYKYSSMKLSDDDQLQIKVAHIYDNIDSSRFAYCEQLKKYPNSTDEEQKKTIEYHDNQIMKYVNLLKKMFPTDTIISYSELKQILETHSVSGEYNLYFGVEEMVIWYTFNSEDFPYDIYEYDLLHVQIYKPVSPSSH